VAISAQASYNVWFGAKPKEEFYVETVTLAFTPREEITFGTDGWRAIIADGFTFDNVALAAKAYAKYLKKEGQVKGVAVGYDTRFLSKEFAEVVSGVIAASNIPVILSDQAIPTPALSYTVRSLELSGGIMITASHNPPNFNGFKVKGAYGGSATMAIVRKIEKEVKSLGRGDFRPTVPLSEEEARGMFSRRDFRAPYLQRVAELADLKGGAPGPIVVDAMHGAGMGCMSEILRAAGYEVIEVRGDVNPSFGGLAPEPIMRNLTPLHEAVLNHKATMGLVTDGDADRIAAMDGAGEYVDSHRIFALLLQFLAEKRNQRGKVVKAFSSTQMIDRLCLRYGLPLDIVQVGFKYVTELMLTEDVLLGGEESGGIGMRGHLPERDGVLNGLLLVKMCEEEKCSLAELVDKLMALVGPHYFDRRDLKLTEHEKVVTNRRLRDDAPQELAGKPVTRLSDIDGYKLFFENDEWLMIRPSGTEPVVRIYSEAQSPEQVQAYLDAIEGWIRVKV
jgi:phosphomannomutase